MQQDILVIYQAAQSGGVDWAKLAIEESRHFIVSKNIREFAICLSVHEARGDGDLKTPIQSRLPAEMILLKLEGQKNGCYLLQSQKDEVAVFFLNSSLIQAGPRWAAVGSYTPGTSLIRNCVPHDGISREEGNLAIWQIAFIVSLINAPSKIILAPDAGSRQHRRAMQRLTGKPPMAWTNVTWELGKALRKGDGQDTQGSPKALHWCRAHPRKCEPHHKGAEWISGPFGSGWYQWIPDCWKGHPDYGFKFQKHTPRFGGTPQAGGTVPTILSAAALSMMEAAKAAALRQAGFTDKKT